MESNQISLGTLIALLYFIVVHINFSVSHFPTSVYPRCIQRTNSVEEVIDLSNDPGNDIGEESNTADTTTPLCVRPVEHLLSGRFRTAVPENSFEPEIPPWFNATLATLGQKFAERYWFGTNIGMIIAELVVVALQDRTQVIFYSGELENWHLAVKRFTSNILQHSVWYKENLFASRSALLDSITKVRSMHLSVLHNFVRGKKKGPSHPYKIDQEVWNAFEKDLVLSNIPVSQRTKEWEAVRTDKNYYGGLNQFTMASTLWGLAAMPIIRPASFGIDIEGDGVKDEDLEGFIHFWAFIGHCVGVEEEFNVCLQPDIQTAKIYFERVLDELITPHLFGMSYEAKVLIESSTKGFTQAVGPIAQFDFILRRMLEDVVGIPVPNLTSKAIPIGRTIDGLWRTVLRPTLSRARRMRQVTDFVYDGYIQNLSQQIWGIDGFNKTIVAEKAFSW